MTSTRRTRALEIRDQHAGLVARLERCQAVVNRLGTVHRATRHKSRHKSGHRLGWTGSARPSRAAHVLYRPAVNTRHWSPRSRDAKLLSTGWHSVPRDTTQERTQEQTQIGVDWARETSARRRCALEIRHQHAAVVPPLERRQGPGRWFTRHTARLRTPLCNGSAAAETKSRLRVVRVSREGALSPHLCALDTRHSGLEPFDHGG